LICTVSTERNEMFFKDMLIAAAYVRGVQCDGMTTKNVFFTTLVISYSSMIEFVVSMEDEA
jgi:hypothetical protein